MQPNGLFLILVHWAVSGLAIMLTAYIVPGFKVRDFTAALIAAFVIGLINLFIAPILTLLTFPLYIITFGLFAWVINAACLKMAAGLLKGFEITSWTSALVGALILAAIDVILHRLAV
jgi:putative membrane protein